MVLVSISTSEFQDVVEVLYELTAEIAAPPLLTATNLFPPNAIYFQLFEVVAGDIDVVNRGSDTIILGSIEYLDVWSSTCSVGQPG